MNSAATILDSRQRGEMWGAGDNCMWGLPSFRRRKATKRKYWFIMCFEQTKRKENFALCLDVWKVRDNRFSNISEWVFQNLKSLKSCRPQRVKRRIQNGDAA